MTEIFSPFIEFFNQNCISMCADKYIEMRWDEGWLFIKRASWNPHKIPHSTLNRSARQATWEAQKQLASIIQKWHYLKEWGDRLWFSMVDCQISLCCVMMIRKHLEFHIKVVVVGEQGRVGQWRQKLTVFMDFFLTLTHNLHLDDVIKRLHSLMMLILWTLFNLFSSLLSWFVFFHLAAVLVWMVNKAAINYLAFINKINTVKACEKKAWKRYGVEWCSFGILIANLLPSIEISTVWVDGNYSTTTSLFCTLLQRASSKYVLSQSISSLVLNLLLPRWNFENTRSALSSHAEVKCIW